MTSAPSSYLVAISCTRRSIGLSAAIYRRLIERLPKDQIYFYPCTPLETADNLEAGLSQVYQQCRLMLVIVGSDYQKKFNTLWEASEAICRLGTSSSNTLMLVQYNNSRIPDCLAARSKTVPRYPISSKRLLLDIEAVFREILQRIADLTGTRVPSARSQSSGDAPGPQPVRRHFPGMQAIFDAESDHSRHCLRAMGVFGDPPESMSANCVAIVRASVECSADLIGTLEQQWRCASVVDELRRLSRVCAPEVRLPRPSRKFVAVVRQKAQRLLGQLVNQREDAQMNETLPVSGVNARQIYFPDELQLVERLQEYLSFHLRGQECEDLGSRLIDALRQLFDLRDVGEPLTLPALLSQLQYLSRAVANLLQSKLGNRRFSIPPANTIHPRSLATSLDDLYLSARQAEPHLVRREKGDP